MRLQKYRKRFWIRKAYDEGEQKGEYYLFSEGAEGCKRHNIIILSFVVNVITV